MRTDIPKNATEVIRIQESEFKGRKYIDVRVWVKPDAPADDPTPTKKGVTFGRDQLDDMICALKELRHQGDGGGRRNARRTGKGYDHGATP